MVLNSGYVFDDYYFGFRFGAKILFSGVFRRVKWVYLLVRGFFVGSGFVGLDCGVREVEVV